MSEYLSDISEAGKGTLEYWGGRWVQNAIRNWGWTRTRLGKGQVSDMGLHPRVVDQPAFVCASGPSLDLTPWRELEEARLRGAGVFCATSNVKALLANGVTPTYVTVVDANPKLGRQAKEVRDLLGDVELLAPPIIDPSLLRVWPGKVSLFRPIQHGDPFLMDTLPKMYASRHDIDETHVTLVDWLTVGFLNAGCVTNAMVLAAAYLGYDPIFIVGNDLGFPGGQGRCRDYHREGGVWYPNPIPRIVAREMLREASNGVLTVSEFLHYKLNLFIAWRLTPCRLYDCSPVGIIHHDEIPKVPVEEALAEWRRLKAEYPIKVGSPEWHTHVGVITERMGMRVTPIKGGFQVQTLSAPPATREVPSSAIVSNTAPMEAPK